MQKTFEKFLAWCVKKAFDREKPFVIAIAGSVGKSSTKTAIGIALGALEEEGGVVMSKKNYNNELGVPLTIFGADLPRRSILKWMGLLLTGLFTALGFKSLRAKTFVLEMGTDRPGDLAKLLEMVKPKISVLTAIGPEHTEFFGSVEQVAKEEAMILSVLNEQDDVAIINADDRLVCEAANSFKMNKLSFGISDDATARIVSTEIFLDYENQNNSGLSITICLYGTTQNITVYGTVGRPQAYAIAAAMACAAAVDRDAQRAASRLSSGYNGMPGRMSLIPGIKKTWLIDDSYNSSPLAVLSALRDLASFPIDSSSKRIAALGDMLELGHLSESAHEEMGRVAAQVGVDLLVLCGQMSGVAAKGAENAGMAEDKIFTFTNSAEAGLFIQNRLKQGDVVLIKGSQGVRMERITKELMAHPDRAAAVLVRHTPDWLSK